MGIKKGLRVDMQGKAGAPEGIATFGALFTTWPPIYESIICGQRGSDCIQISRSLHAHRPLAAGIEPMATNSGI
jgi:hypothetical protein